MNPNLIEQMLAQIPADHLGKLRLVNNLFYGTESRLRKLRTRIKRETDDAIFELGDGALSVTLPVKISLPALTRMAETYRVLAQDAGLEYDGFEIDLRDVGEIHAAFAPFNDHVEPGTAYAFPLSDGRFGHAIFIAGDKKNGYLFQFVRLVTEAPAQLTEVLAAPLLYRQPITGSFDPLTVIPIGRAQLTNLHAPVRFSMLCGWPSPEEMAEIARSVGFEACTDATWPGIAERLVASGRSFLQIVGTVQIVEATISSGGQITWNDDNETMTAEAAARLDNFPMPLTGMGRVEVIEQALLGETDMIDLMDKVSRPART